MGGCIDIQAMRLGSLYIFLNLGVKLIRDLVEHIYSGFNSNFRFLTASYLCFRDYEESTVHGKLP
jgi:hypothetical protein